MDILTNGYFPYNEVQPTDKKRIPYIKKCIDFIDGATDSIPESFKSDIRDNRMYVEAIQNTDIYMERYGLSNGLDGELIDYSDLNFSPIGIPRVIFNALYSRLNTINSINRVECRDEQTISLKNDKFIELRTKAKLAEPIKEITGIDIRGEEYVPDTDIELDVYEKMGGISSSVEVVLQELLKEVDAINKYDIYVNPEINYDIICSGFVATSLAFEGDGTIKEEPIDICKLKVVGGSKRDYSDAVAFRYEIKMSAYDIINLFKPEQIDEAYNFELKKREILRYSDNGICKVHVYYWQCYDTYTKAIKEDDSGIKIRSRSNNKTGIKTNVHKWYIASKIDGSDIIFNYGEFPNIVRTICNSTIKKAQCPITILRVKPYSNTINSSIISVIKKFEDMAVMAWLKLQNEIANAKPSGREYNLTAMVGALDLIDFKDIKEALDYAEQTGNIYTAQKDNWDSPSSGAAFRDIRGGISSAFSDYLEIIKFSKEFSHEISGITTIDTGAVQNPRISNYITKGALSGTDKAIVELLETKLFFMQLSAEKKINMLIKLAHPACELSNPYKSQFSQVKGYVLDLIGNTTAIDIGLRVEQDLTDDEQNQLISEMVTLSQNYRDANGNAGITPIELIHFKDMVKNGNAKFAAYMLSVLQEKRRNDKLQEQQVSMQQNAQIQQQSNQMAMQAKQQEDILKQQGNLEKIKLEKDLELRNKMQLNSHNVNQDTNSINP